MLIRRAPAKLNLALEVVSRRDDGWHDLDSLLVPIDWHDLVGVRVGAGDSAPISVRVTGPHADEVPGGDRNLAWRAAAALCELAPRGIAIDVWLDKQVPSGAGLGGGSADAAAVLRAGALLLAHAGHAIAQDELHQRAIQLGSDVPALLAGTAVRVQGRGDVLRPVRVRTLHAAVAVAGYSNTAATYAQLTPDEIRTDGRVDATVSMLQRDALDDSQLGSALELAARRASAPLAAAIDRLRALTPFNRWHLTGSGGALFAMARDASDAERLAAAARGGGFPARACRTLGDRGTT